MDISAADAAPRLRDLVRRAQAGEEVVLTEPGGPDVKLVVVNAPRRAPPPLDHPWAKMSLEERLDFLDGIQEVARRSRTPGPSAERAADFLYGDDGMPV